jgi:hypothetical protein
MWVGLLLVTLPIYHVSVRAAQNTGQLPFWVQRFVDRSRADKLLSVFCLEGGPFPIVIRVVSGNDVPWRAG